MLYVGELMACGFCLQRLIFKNCLVIFCHFQIHCVFFSGPPSSPFLVTYTVPCFCSEYGPPIVSHDHMLHFGSRKISAPTACLSVIYFDYGSGAIGCDPDDLRDL